ncbi:peptidase S8/S53 domain-containing protein [Dactylonectria estremocensis]|uniref:Peptidase S8/S53 domain-containing protein n=1 Tax=Dactylonectria estremocensis TaxID=1079267 RepID=A0A9P9CYM1_9HYPO|nr:peptidase S8/S53 domain-containing protein [Dactylonectria estremocensis]
MATQQNNILPSQWVVIVKPNLTAEVRQSEHLSKLDDMTVDPSTPFNVQVGQQFDFPELKGYSAKFDDATKTELEKMPEVLGIEPEQLYRHCQFQPDAPWGLGRISARARLGNPPYSYTYRGDAAGAGTVAYVIDTGINDQHIEFERRATKGRIFVADGSGSDQDVHGHGTHVAGTIASRAYGVAKEANVVAVKVFSDITGFAQTSDIIMALQWVVSEVELHGTKGRAVVNLSLGGGASPALDCAVASTVRHGVVVCVAAGNLSDQPADAQSPAREPLAITVGATDINDAFAPFSSFGKTTPHVAGVACCLLSDAAWRDGGRGGGRDPSEVMSKILILADKGDISGIAPGTAKDRTINALFEILDDFFV